MGRTTSRNSAVSTLTSKGQTTIPESIRSELQLEPGDRLEWRTTDTGTIEIVRAGGDWRDLVSFLGAPPRSKTIEELAEDVRRHVGGTRARR